MSREGNVRIFFLCFKFDSESKNGKLADKYVTLFSSSTVGVNKLECWYLESIFQLV
jgi:hypothetical protein